MLALKIPKLELTTPNIKEHWTKTHKRNKKMNRTVMMLLRTHRNRATLIQNGWTIIPPRIEDESLRTSLRIIICRIAPRMLDAHDNLGMACKALIDTIADFLKPGLKRGVADGDKRFTWEICQKKGEPKEYAVEITILQNEIE